ncbi:MAG: choice-of-anchor Q domain-containing protein, partial [Cyanobacteria bacterium J06649_4]
SGDDATGFDGPGDLLGSDRTPINPQLAPLQDNGGPTLTRALLPNSLAIDMGNPNANTPRFDQRGSGFSRVIDGDSNGQARSDIGAFEAPAGTASNPPSLPNPPNPPTSPENLIEGTNRKDRLIGSNRADVIRGFQARDVLNGKGGNDLLEGGSGNDSIVGGSGDDILGGGRGHDFLKGGRGRDTFVYEQINEGKDAIADFKVGEDRIDLSGIFSDARYDSSTPFEDYIRLGQGNRLSARLEVLDINRSRPGKAVFQTLAVLNRVSASELNADSFVL